MDITKEDKTLIRKYMLQPNTENTMNNKQKDDCNNHDKDDNDIQNTMHMIVENGDEDIVMYFLQNGAHFVSNKGEKAAMCIALETNTFLGKEIARILGKQNIKSVKSNCNTIKQQENERGQKINSDKKISRAVSVQETSSSNKHKIELQQKHINNKSLAKNVSIQETTSLQKETFVPVQNQANKNILSRNCSVQEVSYAKRPGTSGVSGQFYETKLLCLVLLKALHDNDRINFYLAANIKDIGDFDDVCFRYDNVACFIQSKHRENTDKDKLTVAKVRSTTDKLGLGIYYDSFLKIRQKFSDTDDSDPMFQGKFENIDSYFILYTPLKSDFDRKKPGNNQIMSKKLHDIIFTRSEENNKNKKNIDVFQFDFEERDIDFLTGFISNEHMKSLGKTFLEFILSSNKLEVMMANNLVKLYHPALAQKVVYITRTLDTTVTTKSTKDQNDPKILFNPNVPTYIHKGAFRLDFFYSEDPCLKTLRNTFCREIILKHSEKNELPKEEVKQKIDDIAKNPCAESISKLIGSPIKFDEANDKLILDNSKLPKNKYNKDEIQQMRYDLQKIHVTKAMVRDAISIAGQQKLLKLQFQLPKSFGNVDITITKKTKKDVEDRLDTIANKFIALIEFFAERNKNQENKIIYLNNDVVGQKDKILNVSQLSCNGGIGGAVGNLLQFDHQTELYTFNEAGCRTENAIYVLNKLKCKIGEDLFKYKLKVDIDSFPRVSYHIHQYDKNIASEFLNKLWFYTNQAQEESVEQTIKTEINKYYNADKQRHQFLFHVHTDAIFLRFHDEIQKWWKRQTDANYLTKSTLIFEKAKKDIVDNPLLTVLNVMFIRKIKHLDVEFDENALESLGLYEFLQNNNNKVLNIVSDAVILSASKIMQTNEHQNNYSFINLDYVHILPQTDYQTMMEELAEIKNKTLVIISETNLNSNLKETLLQILHTYHGQSNNLNKQIIIITGKVFSVEEAPILKDYDLYCTKDTYVNFVDLTLESQTKILEKYSITFQDQDVKLHTIIDESSKKIINSKLLWSILCKDKMEIGRTLMTHKYKEIENCYISRNLKRADEEYEVSNLHDIDDKVVVISAMPCMGKTILLTHLSLETKKINPKPWIVYINMSTHDKDFEKLKKNDVQRLMYFLSNMALKHTGDIHKFTFIELDDETIAIDSNESEDVPFELQLFINFYNKGDVIFLFDGFDKIYPQNTNEGIELFQTLNEANKRIWITSVSYVIGVLEENFGSAYQLDRLTPIQQKTFLQKFWSTNLKLEKLNHDQFNNIAVYVNYILKLFNREVRVTEGVNARPIMPLLSVPLHLLYLTILDHYKNEARSISPHYIRNKLTKKWDLDSFTSIDHALGRSDEEESLELAGTPLHMYILANYFALQIKEKIDLRFDMDTIRDRSNVYINAVTLYERFLKVNIKNVCEIENKSDVGDDQNKLRDEFFKNHKKLALYAICKEDDVSKILMKEEIIQIKDTIKMIETGEVKTPFIDSVVDGVPRFYHLLFAEYFAVEFLSELLHRLKNDDCNIKYESAWDFIVNTVLLACPQGLRNAFEYKLKHEPELVEIATNENSRKIIFSMLAKQKEKTDEHEFDSNNALNIAVNEGLVTITNVLIKSIRSTVNENEANRFITIVKSSANILAAADTKRSILSDNVLKCIQNIDGETIIDVLNSKGATDVVHEFIKQKVVEPLKKNVAAAVEGSNRNENLVNLVEEFPHHLVDFVRQFSSKKH